jgi:branched-chain amino acid transport system substrate-binding protein
MITPSASTSDLAERGFGVFHRLCSRDDVQGPVAARFMLEELKAKKVYVLDDKTTYGQSLADFVAKALSKESNGVKRGQISAADKDFSAILTKIKGEKPDVIFFGLSSPAQAASFIKQAVGLGIKCKFMGGNAQKEKDQYIKGASGLAEGSYVLTVGKDIHDVPQAKEFVSKFEKK